MPYKEYLTPEPTESVYNFFERELPIIEANYSLKEVKYFLEILPLFKQSAIKPINNHGKKYFTILQSRNVSGFKL